MQTRDLNLQSAINTYAYISDCHSSALISRNGSVDWCCMPRIDAASCFGRLLDWRKGGFCSIAPSIPFSVSRRYLPQTLILETTFHTGTGSAKLIDFFPMRKGGALNPHEQLLRIVEGIEGSVSFILQIKPRFFYASIRPWIRQVEQNLFVALGGSDGLLISGDLEIHMPHLHDLTGSCQVSPGERQYLSIIYRKPQFLDTNSHIEAPSIDELGRRFEETVFWWQRWVSQGHAEGEYRDEIIRSAIILKGLSNAPTGAIAAAATTSLPESAGGSRNWDYRFTWVRDSSFAVRSLARVGYTKEADGFRRFVERSVAGNAEEIQILFGVGGERHLAEWNIDYLSGFRGALPVRVGNAAETQTQLDIYGELLDLAWHWHKMGHSPDQVYWDFIVSLVNCVCLRWKQPDQGIWEMRGISRHFVYSKVMCWVALDRGVRLAEELDYDDAPVARWQQELQNLRRTVEERGYDKKRGVFIQAFDFPEMDSSLLLLPVMGFVDFKDDRMVRTTRAVQNDLMDDGFVRRYSHGNDGLKDKEGVFLPCTFWLAECLVRQGYIDEACAVFKRGLSVGNDLDLFSEEYDTKTGELLGNFPQALTHLSLISAALALEESHAALEC